jgi:hypothetical protein
MTANESASKKHYHIRWSGVARLDWEAFTTVADAEASARELLREGETFTVEERDAFCTRCLRAKTAKQA